MGLICVLEPIPGYRRLLPGLDTGNSERSVLLICGMDSVASTIDLTQLASVGVNSPYLTGKEIEAWVDRWLTGLRILGIPRQK